MTQGKLLLFNVVQKWLYLHWDDQLDMIMGTGGDDGKLTVLANVLLETGWRLTVVVVLIST